MSGWFSNRLITSICGLFCNPVLRFYTLIISTSIHLRDLHREVLAEGIWLIFSGHTALILDDLFLTKWKYVIFIIAGHVVVLEYRLSDRTFWALCVSFDGVSAANNADLSLSVASIIRGASESRPRTSKSEWGALLYSWHDQPESRHRQLLAHVSRGRMYHYYSMCSCLAIARLNTCSIYPKLMCPRCTLLHMIGSCRVLSHQWDTRLANVLAYNIRWMLACRSTASIWPSNTVCERINVLQPASQQPDCLASQNLQGAKQWSCWIL